VRWPEEAERLERLRRDHVPRLILVAEGEPAPVSGECEEDWIRLPADDADVRTRLVSLSQRSSRHVANRDPEVDQAGRMRFRGRWVALSKTEVRLARPLVEHTGSVVDYDLLWRSGWPGQGIAHGGQLRIQILRLRRRLQPIGLSIRTVNGRGYVLEPSQPVREA
jgi:DNA-binding response OmpR family regulator